MFNSFSSELAILIPCYNEELTIGAVIDDYQRIFPQAKIYDFNKGIYRIISLLTFTPIILLFLLSLWMNRHKYKLLLPIYLLIIYFTFIHCILFIASLRYRLPLEPFLILLVVSVLINYFPKNQNTTKTIN